MIIHAQSPGLVSWAGRRLNVRFDPQKVSTIAVADDVSGEVIAVVVYSRFTENGCEMSIASDSPRWCSRRFLRAAFQYPFVQCGFKRTTFVTTPGNTKAIDLLERLGAKREGKLGLWFGNEDGLVYGLLHNKCKWITSQNSSQSGSRRLMAA